MLSFHHFLDEQESNRKKKARLKKKAKKKAAKKKMMKKSSKKNQKKAGAKASDEDGEKPKDFEQEVAEVNFSPGQWNFSKVFHKNANSQLITKVALKTFLDFFRQRR